MSTDRDMTRIVRSWLRTDEHESADRVLDNVFALLDATPQRRSWWPVRRIADMNSAAKLATAIAAVVVAAVVVVTFMPRGGGVGGVATPSPSSTPLPSPSPTGTPLPSPTSIAFPPDGPLAVGRKSMTRGGVKLSVDIPTTGWRSDQGLFFNKDVGVTPEGASLLFWEPSPVGVFADPCAQSRGPVVGPSTGDLAAAMSTLADTSLVTAPEDVTVGGHPAKHLVLTVPEDAPCGATAEQFYIWYGAGEGESRYANVRGVTLRIWIIDVDGTRLCIDTETYKGALPAREQEIQAMIDSIQFE